VRGNEALTAQSSLFTSKEPDGFQLPLERRHAADDMTAWIPAFAGMTVPRGHRVWTSAENHARDRHARVIGAK